MVPTAIRRHVLVLLLAGCGPAARGADYVPTHDPELVKPSALALFAGEDLAATASVLARLAGAEPGLALGPPLQAVTLPATLAASPATSDLVAFAESRADFAGVFSQLECQLLAAIATRSHGWQDGDPASVALRAALAGLAERGPSLTDRTALEQRRQLAALLHPGDGFAEGALGRRYERRRLQLIAAGAPATPVPTKAGREAATGNGF